MNIFQMPLPIAAKINRLATLQGQSCEAVDLLTVRQTAVVLFQDLTFSLAQKVRTGNAVMDANLRAAHMREKLICPIGASVARLSAPNTPLMDIALSFANC
jgi:hypothetical protein